MEDTPQDIENKIQIICDQFMICHIDSIECPSILTFLTQKWIIPYQPNDLVSHAYRCLQITQEQLLQQPMLQYENIDKAYSKQQLLVLNISRAMLNDNIIGNNSEQSRTYEMMINTLLDVLYYYKTILLYAHQYLNISNETAKPRLPIEMKVFEYTPIHDSQLKDYNGLVMFILKKIYKHGYKRYNGKCFSEIQSPVEPYHMTHAWEFKCSIEDFINQAIQKENNAYIWSILIKGNNLYNLTKLLTDRKELEFPDLTLHPRTFSFQNGILTLGEKNPTFDNPNYPESNHMYWIPPAFMQYGDSDEYDAYHDRASSKYFNYPFDPSLLEDYNEDNWFDLPTPTFSQILNDQNLPPPAQIMLFILLGRVMYKVGEHDDWQVSPFIRGIANTGKSTILKIICQWFLPENVGVLTGKMESVFWGQSLYNKSIIVCYEAKEQMTVDQATFQSAISGESINIAIKNKGALMVKWTTPIVIAGNVLPKWLDQTGGMTRRIILFEFDQPIKKPNTDLFSKLSEEMGNIILKCNLAYVKAIIDHKNQAISEWMDNYFRETRGRFTEEVSPLHAFLKNISDVGLELNIEHKMPFKIFEEKYKAYCEASYIQYTKLKDTSSLIFEENGIRVEKNGRISYHGQMYQGKILQGIGERQHSVHDI